MEQIVPWAELQALVEPHYPKGEKGRPGMGLSINVAGVLSAAVVQLERSRLSCLLIECTGLADFEKTSMHRNPWNFALLSTVFS